MKKMKQKINYQRIANGNAQPIQLFNMDLEYENRKTIFSIILNQYNQFEVYINTYELNTITNQWLESELYYKEILRTYKSYSNAIKLVREKQEQFEFDCNCF